MLILILAWGAPAGAQTLSIVSGDGQVAAQNFPLPGALVVAARDGAGNALANVPVNWTASGPGTLLMGAQTLTDTSGLASNTFIGASIYGDTAFTQTAITASTGTSSVVFRETTSGWDSASGFMFVQSKVNAPVLGEVLKGPSGGTSDAVVEVLVYGVHQAGVQYVPNVAVRLIPDQAGGPTASCAAGTGQTGADGIARCRVLFGGPAGNGTFSVEVGGGFRNFSPFKFTVTAPSGQPPVYRVSIVAGNGQVGPPGALLPVRLTARVEDAAGNPYANAGVVWQSLSPQTVTLSSVVSTSDASGLVSAAATLGPVTGPGQVRVSANNGQAAATFNLTVTQTTPPPGGGGGAGAPAVLRITGGNNQTGYSGSTLPLALTARVEDAAGKPVPNVSVVWESPQTVTLSGVGTISNAQGLVSAVATLAGPPGTRQVSVRTTGGIQTPFGVTPGIPLVATFGITVTQPQPGAPAFLRIISGNNQTGAPGSQLPQRLTARVEDAAGIPVPNAAVIWQPVNPPAVSLSGLISVSDAEGLVSAAATLGGAGTAQVIVRLPNLAAQATFSLQSAFTLTGVAVISGADQSAPADSAFPQPIVVQVQAAEGPAAGVLVRFAAVSPSVVIPNEGLALTDSTGRASITLRAGPTPGRALVTATAGAFTTSFFLTATGGAPPPSLLSIGNGASGQSGAVSPAEIVALYGAGIAPGVNGCSAPAAGPGPLPLELSGTSVQFSSAGYSAAAPLFAVCNFGASQEFAIVETPADLPPGETTVTVQAAGVTAASARVATAAASPGIFETAMSDGLKRAVARRPDGSYVSLENPARQGERIVVYVTGLGRPVKASGSLVQTNQPGTPGDEASPPFLVSLRLGGADFWPASSLFATDSIGVYLVTFDVPAAAGGGNDVEFTVTALVGDQRIVSRASKLVVQ